MDLKGQTALTNSTGIGPSPPLYIQLTFYVVAYNDTCMAGDSYYLSEHSTYVEFTSAINVLFVGEIQGRFSHHYVVMIVRLLKPILQMMYI